MESITGCSGSRIYGSISDANLTGGIKQATMPRLRLNRKDTTRKRMANRLAAQAYWPPAQPVPL
jgi:hypothetical protein